MRKFDKPQKGKPYDKLPIKTLATFDNTIYAVSTKFDGNQVFITNTNNNKVEFFTSDWKQFDMPLIAERFELLLRSAGDCTLVAEMNYGLNSGKLGDRTKVQGRITTERVNFKKGIKCVLDESLVVLNIFDFIDSELSYTYSQRHDKGSSYGLSMVEIEFMTGKDAVVYAKQLVKDGWEGAMLVEPDSLYHTGKRVNHSIKLKYRKTADLLCIGIEQGEGKYIGMVGSLILQDKAGRIVSVGSGMSDSDRLLGEDYYIGTVVEIEYEQIMDTYIQPTFGSSTAGITVRHDKTKEEID